MTVAYAPIVAVVFAGCTTMSMHVSRADLQDEVEQHFPREIDKRVVTLRASDPEVEFPGPDDQLALRLHVDATTANRRSHVTGTARVQGRIDYVEAEHAFYLRDPEVTELAPGELSGTGHTARWLVRVDRDAVERAIRAAIVEMLRTRPLYQLDARRSEREANAIRHLRSAHIRGQDLVLELGI